MLSDTNFSFLVLISLIIHLVFFILFPYVSPEKSKLYNYSEVELSKVSFEAIRTRVEPEVKVVDKKAEIDVTKKTVKRKPVENAAKLMVPENKGAQLLTPKFGVKLPSRGLAEVKEQIKIRTEKEPLIDIPFGEPEVDAHNLVDDTNLFNNREGIYRPGIEGGKDIPNPDKIDKGHLSKFKEKYVPVDDNKMRKKIEEEEIVASNGNYSLGGTIGNREIISKPDAPEIALDRDVEIEVKFFVLPNGQVREASPILKGDTYLESIAIQYMKSWVFVPLPQNVDQVEQWGKLKIKFMKKLRK